MKNNFAYFIASYNNPHCESLAQLKKLNCNKPIIIVIGKDDPQIDEYKKLFDENKNLFIFDKNDYEDKIDKLGSYKNSNKICTYSRFAISDIAKKLGYDYIVYMFDDILKFALRYEYNDKIKSTQHFDLDIIIELYIDLLESSNEIYVVGPPISSFYFGINSDKMKTIDRKVSNLLVYKTEDSDIILKNMCASVMEDMTMCLRLNNLVGSVLAVPGLQVNVRPYLATKDSYKGMTQLEYEAQKIILLNKWSCNIDNNSICYSKFTPKILFSNDIVITENNHKKLF